MIAPTATTTASNTANNSQQSSVVASQGATASRANAATNAAPLPGTANAPKITTSRTHSVWIDFFRLSSGLCYIVGELDNAEEAGVELHGVLGSASVPAAVPLLILNCRGSLPYVERGARNANATGASTSSVPTTTSASVSTPNSTTANS